MTDYAEHYRMLAADCRKKARQAPRSLQEGYLALARQYELLAGQAAAASGLKTSSSTGSE
jgi:hypothetical protein